MTHALWMSSGAMVWAAHFAALYGFTALACARGFATAVPWVAGGATLAALLALAFLVLRNVPRGDEFTRWMTMAVAGFAAVGVVYETVPLFIVPICA